MRLGQMARKLGVSQAEIVRYLSSQNLEIEDGSNVKLGESHIRSLYDHYAPGEQYAPWVKTESVRRDDDDGIAAASDNLVHTSELPEESLSQSSSSFKSSDPKTEGTDIAQPAQVLPDTAEAPVAASIQTIPLAAEQSDTIRAPKVELAGLKVLGKINLPEPKKKEASVADDAKPDGTSDENPAPPAEQKPRVDRREDGRRSSGEGRGQDDRRRTRSNQREQRPYQNPIAAQREREIEAERERQKKKAAEDKERRTQNYQKRVKHSPPTKAARIIEEPVEELDTDALGAKPDSWFGKFIKWLKS